MIEDIRVRILLLLLLPLVSLSLPSPPFGGFRSISFLISYHVGKTIAFLVVFRVHMNGPRMGHLDPPFVDCHPPHIDSFFVQFSRDGNTHMSSVLVFDSYQQMNAFGPYIYSVNFYPSNEWMVPTLILGSIVIQKTNFHVTPNKFRVSQFVCFICPNGIKWGPKRPCVTWSPKGPQKNKKRAGKMRSLLHVGCF